MLWLVTVEVDGKKDGRMWVGTELFVLVGRTACSLSSMRRIHFHSKIGNAKLCGSMDIRCSLTAFVCRSGSVMSPRFGECITALVSQSSIGPLELHKQVISGQGDGQVEILDAA